MSASNQRMPVPHDLIFPHGCYLVTDVEPMRDFDRSSRENFVQAVDKVTGLRLWSAMAHDADPPGFRSSWADVRAESGG